MALMAFIVAGKIMRTVLYSHYVYITADSSFKLLFSNQFDPTEHI